LYFQKGGYKKYKGENIRNTDWGMYFLSLLYYSRILSGRKVRKRQNAQNETSEIVQIAQKQF